jgi:HK97 family phage major capsid protein
MSDSQDKLAQLRADIDKLLDEARQMRDGYANAGEMSATDIERLEEIEQVVDYKREQAKACERLDRLTAEDPAPAQGARRTSQAPPQRSYTDPRCGFNSVGDFAQSVAMACRPQPQVDQRLAQMAPSTYSVEDVGSDGGYAVPPEFSTQIMEYIGDQNSLYSLCDKTPVNHQLNWPVDEDSPWATTGPQAYWEGEADQYTESKVNLRTAGMKLNKLVALCPVTDELLADSPQLGAYLSSVISKKLRFKVDYGILQGTGAGMPLGILNAPALKSVAKVASQTADTVNSTNILDMFTALYGDYRGNAVWVSNQDVEPDLLTMVVAGSSSDVPVWLPSGSGYSSFSGSPHTTILGRPHIPHQACNEIGDHGDIIFCDFSQYIIGYKTIGPQFASSIHLHFDYGMTCIRATHRLAGMPKWSTTIAARDGSATYSPFVSLAERA